MTCNYKWILVTGACGAIGESTAKLLNENGYALVLTDMDYDELVEKYSNFENVMLISCDLSEEENIKEMFQKVNEKIGKIDGLVHCAGVQREFSINIIKEKDVLFFYKVNVFSTIYLIKYFSKKAFSHDRSSIVLISSLSVHEGAKGNALYASTKGALEGLLMPLAKELMPKIRINAIIPGTLKEGMGLNYIKKYGDVDIYQEYPLGLGETVDISNMVEYLLNEKSKWITGQKFIIDGGRLCR